jgi:hypothetical protein
MSQLALRVNGCFVQANHTALELFAWGLEVEALCISSQACNPGHAVQLSPVVISLPAIVCKPVGANRAVVTVPRHPDQVVDQAATAQAVLGALRALLPPQPCQTFLYRNSEGFYRLVRAGEVFLFAESQMTHNFAVFLPTIDNIPLSADSAECSGKACLSSYGFSYDHDTSHMPSGICITRFDLNKYCLSAIDRISLTGANISRFLGRCATVSARSSLIVTHSVPRLTEELEASKTYEVHPEFGIVLCLVAASSGHLGPLE